MARLTYPYRSASAPPKSSPPGRRDRDRWQLAQPNQQVDPRMKTARSWRQCVDEGTVGGSNVVVRQKVVGVGAVEDQYGRPLVLFDVSEQFAELTDHHGVDQVDRWVVECHSPERRRRTVQSEARRCH